jgi:hypothetical protein
MNLRALLFTCENTLSKLKQTDKILMAYLFCAKARWIWISPAIFINSSFE